MFRVRILLRRILLLWLAFGLGNCWCNSALAQKETNPTSSWQLSLRHRVETKAGSGRFHTLTRTESWEANRTAVIICDVWDAHHSINAVRRVDEMAPRIDQFVKRAREAGATIVHAPSECMPSYVDHAARKRAIELPKSENVPANMRQWCNQIDTEKPFTYPIDQSDGGEDDDLAEHGAWAKELEAKGRNPGSPWRMQTHLIGIDDNRDFISDAGPEIWSLMESRQINNVILCPYKHMRAGSPLWLEKHGVGWKASGLGPRPDRHPVQPSKLALRQSSHRNRFDCRTYREVYLPDDHERPTAWGQAFPFPV